MSPHAPVHCYVTGTEAAPRFVYDADEEQGWPLCGSDATYVEPIGDDEGAFSEDPRRVTCSACLRLLDTVAGRCRECLRPLARAAKGGLLPTIVCSTCGSCKCSNCVADRRAAIAAEERP